MSERNKKTGPAKKGDSKKPSRTSGERGKSADKPKADDRTKGFEKPIKKGGFEQKFKKPKGDPMPSFNDDVRLNKFIANAGICSRREADVLIQSGVVK